MTENNEQQPSVYFTQEALAVLRKNMHMSEETWFKVFRSDPTGWRALLGDD